MGLFCPTEGVWYSLRRNIPIAIHPVQMNPRARGAPYWRTV
jgi:hypothetical protein